MGQEVGWTFSKPKEEEKGWKFSAPTPRKPLEMPKRPGIVPAIGEALKTTGQQIISPVEGAVRAVAGIPAWMAGTAATIGAQPFVGWEKGAETGQKVSRFLGGGDRGFGGQHTAGVEEMLSPLAAPFSLALEKGPELLAPGEPKTQAMLGAGMGLAAILLPKVGVTPKTLIRDAKMAIWKEKSITPQQRAAVISTLNRAEAAGAKTVDDAVKPTPPVSKIKVKPPAEVPKPTKAEAAGVAPGIPLAYRDMFKVEPEIPVQAKAGSLESVLASLPEQVKALEKKSKGKPTAEMAKPSGKTASAVPAKQAGYMGPNAEGKWAVPGGPMADSPAEAVAKYLELAAQSDRAKAFAETKASVLPKIRNGNYTPDDIKSITNYGKTTVTTGEAEGILRELGLNSTQARGIVKKVGDVATTSGGATLYELSEVVEKARKMGLLPVARPVEGAPLGAAKRERAFRAAMPEQALALDLSKQGEAVLGEPRGGSMLPTMELPKRVGPINLERLDMGESSLKLVADMEDKLHQSRIKAGQKGRTWAEAETSAEAYGGAYEIGQVLGKSAEELIEDWKKSTKDLDAKVEATRTLFKTAILEAQRTAKEAFENPTAANEAKAQLAYNRWAIIQFETGGGSGNIGRALNIHKKLARSKDMILAKNYARVLKELGHDKLTPEAMELLASFDENNPLVAMKFLAQARKATTREKLFEIWINSLLSNPSTHLVNMTSNMLFEAMSPWERTVGAAVEFAKHPLKPSKRELYFGEAAHSIVGAFHGMREGLNRYAYAMEHGQTLSGVSKFEAPRAAIKGLKGEVIRIPTKELMANDDFFKAIIYSDDIYAQAYRIATKEGLRGDVRKAKMAELIANPTEAMSEAANRAAKTRTFQSELGKLGKDFMRLRSRSVVGEFVFPFVRTPVNIVKEGLRRTPFGIMEAHKLTGAEQSMAIGREISSLATAALVAKLVGDGNITGSAPTDRAERERLYNTGWRPYSLKIGGTYYSYGRLEPMATYLGVMADSSQVFHDMGSKEWTKLAAKIGTAFRNNISNKTFLTGMTDVINATTDPGRYGEMVLKRWATSLVPASGMLGAITKATDPEIKDARNVIEWYKARLPVLSRQVQPKRNVMGEPQKAGGTPVSRLLSPVATSREVKDTVYQELDRLGVNLGPMSTTFAGKKLPIEQARAMLTEAGPEIKKAVYQLITSPVYKAQSDENKRKMLKSWITKTRAYQKGLFIIK